MSPSYGYTYLTSYGWSGTGTGLRKGAIAKPLTIPQKKNLSGLGKDRDEAFPFWDHLFSAASKSITIKVSSDDEDDEDEDPSSQTDAEPVLLRRTTTGIISNRRPITGTPVSTSGSATPNRDADTHAPGPGVVGHLSLLAVAKREAAKRNLYAQFFRGPVLGPDDDPRVVTTSHLGPPSSQSSVASVPVPERVGDGDVVGETGKSKKRKSEDKVETKEERRERKRLKKERKAARARKRSDEGVQAEENQAPKMACKQARKPLEGLAGDESEQAKCTQRLEEELASTNDGQQPPSNVDATGVPSAVLTTKKKKGKRKDTSF